MIRNKQDFLFILLLAGSNTAIYGVPYLKDMFYELLKKALELNNTQIGMIFSLYGVISFGGYLVGGILADRFPVKKLIGFSCATSAILCFLLIFFQSFIVVAIIFSLFAVVSVLTFYPAIIKAISQLESDGNQGNMYGMFYLFSSVFGMIISVASVLIVSCIQDEKEAFKYIVFLYGFLNLYCASYLWKSLETRKVTENKLLKAYTVSKTIRQKGVWMLIGIVLSNYLLNCMGAYLNVYLCDVLGFGEKFAYIFSIIRIYVIVLLISPIMGRVIVCMKSAINVIQKCFWISSICLFFITIKYDDVSIRLILVCCILTCFITVVATHVIAFVPISEMGIPTEIQGAVIGLMSFVGFSPDAYYYLLMGKIFDIQGNQGFRNIFMVSMIISCLGIFCSGQMKGEKQKNE